MNQAEYQAYEAGQIALGRDMSELRPGIRECWSMIRQAERASLLGDSRTARGIMADMAAHPDGPEVIDWGVRNGRLVRTDDGPWFAKGTVHSLPPGARRHKAAASMPSGEHFGGSRPSRLARLLARLRAAGLS